MFTTPVREYMSRALVSVRPDMPLDRVAHLLEERDISCVAVTDEAGVPTGIVSTTDLLRDALRAMAPEKRLARDVMSTAIIGVDEMQTVRDAAQAMVTHRIHRVLVYRQDKAIA